MLLIVMVPLRVTALTLTADDDDGDDSRDDGYSKELLHAQSGVFITLINVTRGTLKPVCNRGFVLEVHKLLSVPAFQ